MDSSIKKRLISGSLWSLFGQFGYILIGALANIFLARLLGPKVFGQIGIIMFFIIISKVLTESGLSGALIRKNDVTEKDYSTVFIFNLCISLLLMLILILASSHIAAFYKDPQLEQLLKIASLILPIDAFRIVQNAKLVHRMNFKKKSMYELVTVVIASTIGVGLALVGNGVWAIVVMQLSTAFILTLLLWIFEGPLKKIRFSKDSFMGLYKFGLNTTLTSLLNTGFDNIYQLILGKYFSLSQTGYFYQAKKLQTIPFNLFSSLINGVFYSTFSKVQDNQNKFNFFFEKVTSALTVIYGIITLLMLIYAEFIITILFGIEWIDSSFFLKILILASFFNLQERFIRVAFKVYDKTNYILNLEIVKKCIQSLSIVIGVITLNIDILLYGFLITNIISSLVNRYYFSKILSSSFSKYFTKITSISSIIIFIFLICEIFVIMKNINMTNLLFFSPIVILVYFSLMKLTRIFDISTEFKLIKNVFNKN